MDMAKPFISAYKAGDSTPDKHITSDSLIYWYRPTLRSLDCDATDTCMAPAKNDSGNYFLGRPNGWETLADEVFVVTLLTSPATVVITSGSSSAPLSFDAPAGASAHRAPLLPGRQSFALTRGPDTVLAGASPKDVSAECVCGLYNFNAFVGSLPAAPPDPLGPDGLASLTVGLKVSTCAPTPSLPPALNEAGTTLAEVTVTAAPPEQTP